MTFRETLLVRDRLSRLSCRAQVLRAGNELGHDARPTLSNRWEGSMLANDLGVFVPPHWRALFVRAFKRAALVSRERGSVYRLTLTKIAFLFALLLGACGPASGHDPLAELDPGMCFYCGPSCAGILHQCTPEEALSAPCSGHQSCSQGSLIYGPDDPNNPNRRDR